MKDIDELVKNAIEQNRKSIETLSTIDGIVREEKNKNFLDVNDVMAIAKTCPIDNHWLSKQTDTEVIVNYLILLCFVAIQCDDSKRISQLLYPCRIIAGIKNSINIESCFRLALSLKEEELNKFLIYLKKFSIEREFVLDAFLMALRYDKGNVKKIECIVDIGVLLGLNRGTISDLADISICSLKGHDADIGVPQPAKLLSMMGNAQNVVVITKEFVITSKKDGYDIFKRETLLENELKKFKSLYKVIFYKLTIESCDFVFDDITEVVFDGCLFEHIRGCIIRANDVSRIRICNSVFSDCCLVSTCQISKSRYGGFNLCGEDSDIYNIGVIGTMNGVGRLSIENTSIFNCYLELEWECKDYNGEGRIVDTRYSLEYDIQYRRETCLTIKRYDHPLFICNKGCIVKVKNTQLPDGYIMARDEKHKKNK